jgi:type IV secretory pathway TrbD component
MILLALVLLTAELPDSVTMVLTLVFLAAVFGMWLVTTDLRRWGAMRVARVRRLWRRVRRMRA